MTIFFNRSTIFQILSIRNLVGNNYFTLNINQASLVKHTYAIQLYIFLNKKIHVNHIEQFLEIPSKLSTIQILQHSKMETLHFLMSSVCRL